MQDGREYSIAVNASNNVGNKQYVNYGKTGWYISVDPLPPVIKNNHYVQNDLVACSAYSVMKTRPMHSLRPELKENEYYNFDIYFAGFGESAIMC